MLWIERQRVEMKRVEPHLDAHVSLVSLMSRERYTVVVVVVGDLWGCRQGEFLVGMVEIEEMDGCVSAIGGHVRVL